MPKNTDLTYSLGVFIFVVLSTTAFLISNNLCIYNSRSNSGFRGIGKQTTLIKCSYNYNHKWCWNFGGWIQILDINIVTALLEY